MKDINGVDRGRCMKTGCDCDEYTKEKQFNLCSYCEHTPVAHDAAGTSSSAALLSDLSVNMDCDNDSDATIDGLASLSESAKSPSTVASWSEGTTCGPSIPIISTPVRGAASTPAECNLSAEGLRVVLEECTDGLLVLRAPQMTYHLRAKLAGVVVNHILQMKHKKGERPKNADIEQAAQALVGLFPTEKMEVWYTPPKAGGKKIAGGKLTEKLRNTWRMLKQHDPGQRSTDTSFADDDIDEEMVRDDLNWLKYNMQPWTVVLQKWEKTAAYRVQVLQSGVKKLDDFKLYADRRVDSLLNVDFLAVCRKFGYGDCSNKLYEVWPDVTGKLRGIHLPAKVRDAVAGDDEDVQSVKLLVHLACAKRSIRLSKGAKRKTWCPSLTDCLHSFVIFAQTLDEAERTLEYLRRMYSEMQLKLQPLIMAAPTSTVVVYDSHRFLAESLVKGIDICFKLTQVLHLEYNTASYPLWLFVQRYIYGLTCSWDIPSPKAAELATTLRM